MIILSSKKRVVEQTVIEWLFCNCCGTKIDFQDYEDYVTINANFGYFAQQFEDGTQHQSHLCEKCYKLMIQGFKYYPQKPVHCCSEGGCTCE